MSLYPMNLSACTRKWHTQPLVKTWRYGKTKFTARNPSCATATAPLRNCAAGTNSSTCHASEPLNHEKARLFPAGLVLYNLASLTGSCLVSQFDVLVGGEAGLPTNAGLDHVKLLPGLQKQTGLFLNGL